MHAKFCCAPLRIKKALGILRELIITTRRTTKVAFRDKGQPHTIAEHFFGIRHCCDFDS